jgi:hypothetical protein
MGQVHAADDHEIQRACILDASLAGVGMLLTRPLEPGQLVVITIRTNVSSKPIELSARVRHCSAMPHGDWLIGCELVTRLTPAELEQLL